MGHGDLGYRAPWMLLLLLCRSCHGRRHVEVAGISIAVRRRGIREREALQHGLGMHDRSRRVGRQRHFGEDKTCVFVRKLSTLYQISDIFCCFVLFCFNNNILILIF